MNKYSPFQFSFFRIILGAYLCLHFVQLIPYASEIWSSQGILPDPSINLTFGYLPNIFSFLTEPFEVTCFIVLLVLLSFALMIGYQRPVVSILLWYAWFCLFDRNNFILNPGIPYIGWLLLCCAILPKGEPLSATKAQKKVPWKMPMTLFWGAWFLMAAGYTISGFDKMHAPSWQDGSAIYHLIDNPLARDWFLRDLLLLLPDWFFKGMTWIILLIELCFLPLTLWKPSRKWIWLATIAMHLGILLIVDFADLTIGMLMIHWFTFDSTWLKAKPKDSGVIFYDGWCGLCNHFTQFLLKHDQFKSNQFTSLQGEYASKHLPEAHLQNFTTMIYKRGDKIYTHSDAILQAISSLGGVWKLFIIFKLIPEWIRNKGYEYFASNRYYWFGNKEVCRLLSPKEKARFLD